MQPRVGVVLTTYDEPATVLRRSVRSVLDQTIHDLDVVVVDDNPGSDSREVVDQFDDERLDYVQHETNRGGSAARNTGADETSGNYVAFLDADDRWLPTKLEAQLECLESRTDDWRACYCDATPVRAGRMRRVRRSISSSRSLPFGTSENSIKEGGRELIPPLLRSELRTGGTSTLLVERDIFERIGGFDETFPRHQDWEFLIRVLKTTNLAYLDRELVLKRESSPPSPETVIESKKRYLQKFLDEIESMDEDVWDLCLVHRHELGRFYLKHGRVLPALNYLEYSQISGPAAIVVYLWDYVRGLRLRLES
jgi:glycosyltransferase involved in cell wall biosynthesis